MVQGHFGGYSQLAVAPWLVKLCYHARWDTGLVAGSLIWFLDTGPEATRASGKESVRPVAKSPEFRHRALELVAQGEPATHVVKLRETHGAARLHAKLQLRLDIHCSCKRVTLQMRADGLQGVCHRHKRGHEPSPTNHDDPVKRQFRAEGVEPLVVHRHRVADGWAYCFAALDAWSRRVADWQSAPNVNKSHRGGRGCLGPHPRLAASRRRGAASGNGTKDKPKLIGCLSHEFAQPTVRPSPHGA